MKRRLEIWVDFDDQHMTPRGIEELRQRLENNAWFLLGQGSHMAVKYPDVMVQCNESIHPDERHRFPETNLDRITLIKDADPRLEALLDEEERIARKGDESYSGNYGPNGI